MPTSPQQNAVALVEPQMEGFYHAPFNAALLHTVALAHPGAPLAFHAFASHLEVVRGILAQHAPEQIDRIAWRPLPPTSANGPLARMLEARSLIRSAAALAPRVLFSSISRMQLLHLKRFLRRQPQLQVRAVLHGDLDRIEHVFKERFPNNLFPLQRVLRMPHPANLRYLVLGASILQNLPDSVRPGMLQTSAIDHPYHFPPVDPAPPDHLLFGVYGNSGEGRLLEQVARAVKDLDPSVRFSLIGFLSNPDAVARLSPLAENATAVPIPRETFLRLATQPSHALWLAPPGGFRLRASGTFFDALAYGKPLVYTANPYIDAFYADEPGIGVRCETVDQVPAAILEIARNPDPDRYAAAQRAILNLRRRFTPQEQARTLPAALDW